jgi:hypothetical protein
MTAKTLLKYELNLQHYNINSTATSAPMTSHRKVVGDPRTGVELL